MKDGTTTSGRAAYDEAMAQLREADPEPVSETAYSENYAAWLAAGRPMHEFRPRVKYASLCGTCGARDGGGAHPPGITAAQALAALDSRPSTGPGTGMSAMVQPAELVPLRQLARAVRWEQQQAQDRAERALAALEGQQWPGDYAAACEQLVAVTAILSGATS